MHAAGYPIALIIIRPTDTPTNNRIQSLHKPTMASTNQSKFTSKLLNAKVLILGGTSGMGFAVAEGSLEFGARVVISSSSASKLDNALNRLRTAYPSSADKISGYTCDLSKPEQLEGNIKALLEKAGGGIDHVVFTAGDRLSVQPLDTFTPEVMSKAMTVRVTAPMVLAKVVGPYLSPGPKTSISLTSGTQSYKPVRVPCRTHCCALLLTVPGADERLGHDRGRLQRHRGFRTRSRRRTGAN